MASQFFFRKKLNLLPSDELLASSPQSFCYTFKNLEHQACNIRSGPWPSTQAFFIIFKNVHLSLACIAGVFCGARALHNPSFASFGRHLGWETCRGLERVKRDPKDREDEWLKDQSKVAACKHDRACGRQITPHCRVTLVLSSR